MLARLWTFIGFAAASRYDSKRGLSAGERGLSYARVAGDERLLIEALIRCTNAADSIGDIELATSLHAELASLKLTPRQRLSFLSTEARIAGSLGDAERAARAWDEYLAAHRALGNFRGQSIAIINAAEVAHQFGDTHRAIALARDGVATAERAQDDSTTIIKMNLAAYLLAVDDWAAARVVGSDVLRLIAKKDPSGATVCSLVEHLALADALDGNFVRAAELLGFTERETESAGFEREHTEIVTHDRLTALLRTHLSDVERAAHVAAGAALTPTERSKKRFHFENRNPAILPSGVMATYSLSVMELNTTAN